jgi:acyl-CoA dehydrogenase
MADPAVSDTDFRDILDATRQFIRSAVMPRELEIMTDNPVPDDIRDQAKKMGLFGYAIPQEWFRHERPEVSLVGGHCVGRGGGVVRADRAGRGIESCGTAHEGRSRRLRRRRSMGDHRAEAFHHQRADRRPVRRLRPEQGRRLRRPPGIAVFLVPADADGVAVGPKDAKMGQEGAGPPTSASTVYGWERTR